MNTNDADVLLRVEGLKKHFPIKRGILRRVVGQVRAVDGVDFHIRRGETLGLVGESGCGKSTTGRCIIRLHEPTDGKVSFRQDDELVDLRPLDRRRMLPFRRAIQIIFQDPFSSLDNRMTIRDIVAEPMKVHKIGTTQERTDRVAFLLEKVGLKAEHLERYPHEFSGGQRQRIGVARALALSPSLIICDEPVSALDVSVQAQVLNLLEDMQEEFGLTYLFIAHDLAVVEHISDRVMVMYLGKIVEVAEADEIYTNPKHPYSEALLQSIPAPDPRLFQERIPLEGTVPNPANPPSGCYFHTRCPYVQEICRREQPPLAPVSGNADHYAACHFADELDLRSYADRFPKLNEGAG